MNNGFGASLPQRMAAITAMRASLVEGLWSLHMQVRDTDRVSVMVAMISAGPRLSA
jgi:hypothetical protein